MPKRKARLLTKAKSDGEGSPGVPSRLKMKRTRGWRLRWRSKGELRKRGSSRGKRRKKRPNRSGSLKKQRKRDNRRKLKLRQRESERSKRPRPEKMHRDCWESNWPWKPKKKPKNEWGRIKKNDWQKSRLHRRRRRDLRKKSGSLSSEKRSCRWCSSKWRRKRGKERNSLLSCRRKQKRNKESRMKRRELHNWRKKKRKQESRKRWPNRDN